ncbi:hypothetical protein JB92DRAFT_3100492 [Gautieria morchelliformis]|nr:hypothetical protein JB92DRAFT_3100492 [Gautieria morchelliformis]
MPNVYNAILNSRTVTANVNQVVISTPYDPFSRMGVSVVVTTAAISLACAVAILTIMGISFRKRQSGPSAHFFVRTHAAAYFLCLLFGDILQAVATMMSIKWITIGGVSPDMFCSVQGAIKNAGNLSISLWTLVAQSASMLATHTFCVLFLRWKPKDWVLYATLGGVWLLIGFMVVIGPGAIEQSSKGPYFGISGYWCWISDPYRTEQIALEYVWLLGSAGLSFILYVLTFLRLRGNIYVEGGKVRFCRIDSDSAWMYQAGRDSTDIQMTAVARGMIGFPILFTILVLPIAICRFIDWSGGLVPVQATIFSDAIFSLAGIFDLILFVSTRSLMPSQNVVTLWFYPRQKIPDEIKEYGVQPYNVKDFASAHGFNEMHQSTAERNMVTLPPRTSKSLTRPATSPRSTRPLSLGQVPLGLSDPPKGQRGNRATMKTMTTRYSQDDSNFEYPEATSPAAWDDVDLGQRTADRSTFASKASPRQRDTQYTTFSLSAYQYPRDSEVPPMPSAAAFNLGAGRPHADDDDDRSPIVGAKDRSSYASTSSSMSYDLRSPEIKAPQPAARRF